MKNNFIDNPITKLLGIDYPIFQGAMAWISDAALAAAVSNAGGLGIIAAGAMDYAMIKAQIQKAKSLTKKPFAVNIMLMSSHADDVARVVVEEDVKVVTTGAGNPAKYMKDWLAAGIKVVPIVPSVAYAKFMAKAGAHALICEGCEAGGHIGDLTTMALVPQVADAVDLPLIAAGGIADGRGMAASFMLGARGVQVGTRFLVAHECGIHQNYKDLILKATDIGTMVTGRRTGHPVRGLKSIFSNNFKAVEDDLSVSNEQIHKMGSGALRAAAIDGDKDKGSFMAGQVAGLVKKEESCKEIIEDIMSGFWNLMKK